VIEHPALELVGVWVSSDAKAGMDAGDLCGLPPTGIIATTDPQELLDLSPDCILHMPRTFDADELCSMLASGANVVTARGELIRPASVPELAARVNEACLAGGTSLHGTGSSPGFITEAMPFVLASLQRRLDSLLIEEFADLSGRPSPDLLFNIMGFGRPLDEVDSSPRNEHLRLSFGPSLELIADAMGIPLDEVVADGELAATTQATTIAAGTLDEGTVGAQRTTISGLRNGEAVLKFRATWFCTQDTDPRWDVLPTGWRVTVEGDSPMVTDIRLTAGLDDMAGYTANRCVNAVPHVVAAPPGIVTTVDLPQIIPTLS
jgi:4-hydroxy-tetrahydrodipicolinate reductase